MDNFKNIYLRCLPLGELCANCYLISKTGSQECVCIDPGDEGDKLLAKIKERNLQVKTILLTHGHADHVGALNELREAFPEAKVCVHKKDAVMLADPERNLSTFLDRIITCRKPDAELEDGEEFRSAGLDWKVIWTPGHTEGGCCFLCSDPESGENALFSGDTLFHQSVGRTDFPGGNYQALMDSIRNKLLTLPPETLIYPGHGEATSVKAEAEENPYVKLC